MRADIHQHLIDNIVEGNPPPMYKVTIISFNFIPTIDLLLATVYNKVNTVCGVCGKTL